MPRDKSGQFKVVFDVDPEGVSPLRALETPLYGRPLITIVANQYAAILPISAKLGHAHLKSQGRPAFPHVNLNFGYVKFHTICSVVVFSKLYLRISVFCAPNLSQIPFISRYISRWNLLALKWFVSLLQPGEIVWGKRKRYTHCTEQIQSVSIRVKISFAAKFPEVTTTSKNSFFVQFLAVILSFIFHSIDTSHELTGRR